MAHDYADNYELFETDIKYKEWGWCEITDYDIKDVSSKLKLIEYKDINFKEEMWVCKTKKETTKKILL